MRKMVEWYVPLGDGGSDEMRRRVIMDFERFDTQANGWFVSFANQLPQMPSLEELQKNNMSFGSKMW